MQPVPFTVTCPPALLARLQTALADPIFPDENLPDADTWNYGIPPRVLKKLVEHWRDKYEWGFWEKKINQVTLGGYLIRISSENSNYPV